MTKASTRKPITKRSAQGKIPKPSEDQRKLYEGIGTSDLFSLQSTAKSYAGVKRARVEE